jgi:hypothetical protein
LKLLWLAVHPKNIIVLGTALTIQAAADLPELFGDVVPVDTDVGLPLTRGAVRPTLSDLLGRPRRRRRTQGQSHRTPPVLLTCWPHTVQKAGAGRGKVWIPLALVLWG